MFECIGTFVIKLYDVPLWVKNKYQNNENGRTNGCFNGL